MTQGVSLGKIVSALSVFALSAASQATVTYTVSFDDPSNLYSAYDARITSTLLAAGSRWSSFLTGSSTINIQVGFDPTIATANGASTYSSFVKTANGLNVVEQGAAAKARTGTDGNGSAPDARLNIGSAYLMNELFFDPDPAGRSAPVPSNRTDAESVFIHELGHIFAFNGFRDSYTGLLLGNFESTYDALTMFDGTNFFFTGARAEAIYGGPVPLTYGNETHVGNVAPRPGSDLISDLMNGVVYYRGARYDISALDFAIACDVGVAGNTCQIPEPSSNWLIVIGGIVLLTSRKLLHMPRRAVRIAFSGAVSGDCRSTSSSSRSMLCEGRRRSASACPTRPT